MDNRLNPPNFAGKGSVVLVLADWGGEPLLARTVERGQSLWLGDRPGDLPLPTAGRLCLVAFDRAQPALTIPGGAEPDRQVEISGSETLRLKFGAFSLAISRVELDPAQRLRPAADPARHAAAVAFLLLTTLAVLARSLPSLGLTDIASIQRALAVDARAWLGAGLSIPDPPAPPLHLSPTPTHYLIPITGHMRCGSDIMGQPEAIAEGRYAVEGPKDNPDPHLASKRGDEPAELHLEQKTKLYVGGDRKAPTMPWAHETVLGIDTSSARGKMWGDPIDDAAGNDGFGLPRVEGGIAKGLHSTTSDSPEAPARVLHTGLRVRGALRPSAVTSSVATRFDRFHACYERARERAPDLTGRAELHFDVGSEGRISGTSVRSSTLGDPDFNRCLVASIDDLTLPAARAGTSSVSYPLFFEPGSGAAAKTRAARGVPPRELPRSCCSR